eukprot:154464_1
MASLLFALQLTLLIALIYVFVKLSHWFFSPYIIDSKDKLPTIRDYTFTDPSITAKYESTAKFPTINDKPTKSISLVFPAYNEEKRIRACLDPTIKYLIDREEKSKKENNSKSKPIKHFSWEIIVVNDGSKDKTCNVVQEYVTKYTA